MPPSWRRPGPAIWGWPPYSAVIGTGRRNSSRIAWSSSISSWWLSAWLGQKGDLGALDPARQFKILKDVADVTALGTSGSGAETVERYAFRYVAKPTDPTKPDRIPISGTVEVNARSQLISKLSYEGTFDYSKNTGRHNVEKVAVSWAYSNYGKPVGVTPAPTASN